MNQVMYGIATGMNIEQNRDKHFEENFDYPIESFSKVYDKEKKLNEYKRTRSRSTHPKMNYHKNYDQNIHQYNQNQTNDVDLT